MSRSADPKFVRRSSITDSGFSLLEIVVALGIFMLVVIAVVPQVISSIRAADLGNDVTEAKGVAQGHIELLRSLPYLDPPSANDVIRGYYPNVSPGGGCTNGSVPGATATGYIAAGTGQRCDFEPTGAFYRKVAVAPGSQFTLVTNAQFLNAAGNPLAPNPGLYASAPYAASPLIGLTVTVVYLDRGVVRTFPHYTEVSRDGGQR